LAGRRCCRLLYSFAAADAFQLERLGRRFETVLDCELFHTFDGDERPGYVASLASVTEHDGTAAQGGRCLRGSRLLARRDRRWRRQDRDASCLRGVDVGVVRPVGRIA